MTNNQIIQWIAQNLGASIQQALDEHKKENPNLIYTQNWLIGMTNRETGFLIARYVSQGKKPEEIHPLMKGDYHADEKKYHGYGYMQIDIGSYPDFINSGNWKDPFKTYLKAIEVLEEKRKFLQSKLPSLQGEDLCRAITAAYNCGQGNVLKALQNKKDIDCYTFNHDYSKAVWEFRNIYDTLAPSQESFA